MENLKKEMKTIAGEWDGDFPGVKEDRAMTALEILDLIKKIEELKEEL